MPKEIEILFDDSGETLDRGSGERYCLMRVELRLE
jgi:hypothetical protein